MHNPKRDMIKWLPFESVVSSKKIVNEILKEKKKIIMPVLSDDQKNNIEIYLVNHYHNHTPVSLEYFYDGYIFKINKFIKKIDFTYHKIYFENLSIYFEQITSVS